MGVLPALKFESLMQVGEQNYACFLREIISSSERTTYKIMLVFFEKLLVSPGGPLIPAPTNQ